MKEIDGKYRVLRELGEGFGGEVFLVEQDGRPMALKRLRMRMEKSCLSPEEVLENFKLEFSTLKNLNHPHILRILDFGHDHEAGFYYFTTEYIEGKNIFEATRNLDPDAIEELFLQILRALSYLHSQRIFHFDIKPANLLVTQVSGARVAKLIDFGLATFQKKGLLAGSVSYISPEALCGQPRDGRSDLYSLGVTWYECLTGANPFASSDVRRTLELQRMFMPPPVSTQGVPIPKYLDPILEKLLRKNPTQRYHRSDQVIRDLNWSAGKNYPLETEATALAYLPGEGQLVGREKEWADLLAIFNRIFLTESEPKACVLIKGGPGTGKSRLIKELKYHAQLHTVPVLDFASMTSAGLTSNALLLIDNAGPDHLEEANLWMQKFSRYSFMIVLAGSNLAENHGLGTFLTLQNFEKSDVGKYIGSVLGVGHPPPFLTEEIFARTGGNPRFVTDLLQTLIRSHQMFDQQGRWSLSLLENVGIDFQNLPAAKTISEHCHFQFWRIPEFGRRCLAALALAQGPLNRGHLSRMGLVWDPSAWAAVEEEKLIQMDPVSGELRLLNPNFQEWIPANLPPEDLAKLHQTIGGIFLDEGREEAHYHLGFGLEPPFERFQHLIDYGEAMMKKSCWMKASRIFKKAREIAPGSQEAVDAHLNEARALFRAQRHDMAHQILDATREILTKERDSPNHWHWVQQTYREMGSLFLKERRLDLAREALQASLVLLEEHHEDASEKMLLENFRVSILMREGRLQEALNLGQKNFQDWHSLPQDEKKKVLNNELGSIYLAMRRFHEAKTFFSDMAAFSEIAGNPTKQAYALYGWGESCFFLEEYREAEAIYHSCAELSRQLKNEELLFHCYNGLGNIAYLGESWDRAAGHYRAALELSEHQADVDSTVGIAINLALVLRLQGDTTSALVYLQHVINTLEVQVPPSIHQLQFLVKAYLELGGLRLENFEAIEARESFRDAARLVRVHPGLERYRFAAYMGLAESNLQLDRTQEAEGFIYTLEKDNLSEKERAEFEELKNLFQKKGWLKRKGAAG